METDANGHVTRFLEKPKADEITCNTINAGIYVLEPDTFDRIPKDVSYSIERAYFPSLNERGETFVAYVDRGYWIDIGTPEKYIQVHRDMFEGRFSAGPYQGVDSRQPMVSPEARIDDGATITGPVFHRCRRACEDRRRRSDPARSWAAASSSMTAPGCRTPSSGRTPASARTPIIDGPILGRNCHIGRNVSITGRAVVGDKTTLTDYTHL